MGSEGEYLVTCAVTDKGEPAESDSEQFSVTVTSRPTQEDDEDRGNVIRDAWKAEAKWDHKRNMLRVKGKLYGKLKRKCGLSSRARK